MSFDTSQLYIKLIILVLTFGEFREYIKNLSHINIGILQQTIGKICTVKGPKIFHLFT